MFEKSFSQKVFIWSLSLVELTLDWNNIMNVCSLVMAYFQMFHRLFRDVIFFRLSRYPIVYIVIRMILECKAIDILKLLRQGSTFNLDLIEAFKFSQLENNICNTNKKMFLHMSSPKNVLFKIQYLHNHPSLWLWKHWIINIWTYKEISNI